jgi:hypothetical protein
MDDRSAEDTEPGNNATGKRQQRRFNTLDLLLGFLLGLLASLVFGLALWMFGGLTIGGGGCPETATCPETSATPLICPTCAPVITTPLIHVVTATLTLTPTATGTPTPDLAATATAACATFESQFPATPCP